MPAVKKELPGREDLALALATFHPTLAALPLPPLPAYLAPLPAAAALPPTASLPASAPSYEALLTPSLRPSSVYLNLHEAAPHLYLPRDPLAFERFSATATAAPDFQPLLDNGEPCIEVECGANRALLYVRKLCQGSKGPSIRHRGEWLTPNEFQFVSGRETAKDWKRSIRHKGKSLKTLMSKGILQVHPPICDCPGCRISSPVNRGRLANKRTVTLPPTHALKKERTTSFSASDGDSDGSGPVCRQQPGLKQENDSHVHIMKRRIHTHWDVNISFRETSCSVHRSHHLVMPEHPSHCDFQRGNVDIGLGPAGDLLGKRLGCSSYITSDCSSEKKVRSKSPQETLLLPELESTMAPEDHYHRLMSALSEAGPFEETQRLYHLGIPSHDLLRVRQEVATATLRNPSSLEVHLPSSTGHRRKQGLFQNQEGTVSATTPSFPERELSHPPPLLSPQNAPHMALGSQLRPPFFGVPTALCQTPGYSFLPPAQAEMLVRQQELLRKQSLARLEMSELLRQKELGSTHRPQLLPPEVTLRIPEGPDELQRRSSMLVLKHSSAPLLALPPQGPPGPGPPTPPKESAQSLPQKGSLGAASAPPSEPKETTGAGLWTQDVSEELSKDSDEEDPEIAAARGGASTTSQAPAGGTRAEGKGPLSGSTMPPPLPLGFPCGAVSPYFHTGTLGGLFTDETTAPEDVNKWTVDDVCNFVGGLSGCGEYARIFREQGIDGETLPLLTEEHLLNTMGLKLGPALKIRAQVAKRLGRVFYMASFPVALPLQPPSLQAPELSPGQQLLSPATTTSPYEGAHLPTGPASPKQENGPGTIALFPGAPDPSQLL
ncbi:sterile alpha motif domain-containing protein 11 isoform X2 [Mesocricetus auratus]|uniref:Sterile alpha motif domain-containing protein 11 isoform X2 n=1 Tax=Mesocricetus auratus TaxID=10036 RepID=A0A1U8CIF1_MESAU|nr:sterile alpha motif domain-containing protein 11 isoform X2 [Mesocricetus auratus]